MWRCHRDESGYSDVKLLAWHWALPFTHLPIIDQDYKLAEKYEQMLTATFTEQEISAAVARLKAAGAIQSKEPQI